MSDGAEWVGWVGPARNNEASALEQLEQYFTPFIHAVALSRVGHHLAGKLIKPAFALAVRRLATLSEDSAFGTAVLTAAREQAAEVAKTPGATTDRAADVTHNPGLATVAKLRQLPEASRERLLMRLLEGIPGFEIAEVVGGDEALVRAELERGAASLVKELTHQSMSFVGDSYLWSLVGAPHAALIPLENQLTPLRYDPTLSVDSDETPAVPQRAASRPTEGRRSTSDNLLAMKPPEATEPSGGSLAPSEPPTASNPMPLEPAVASDGSNPFGTSVKTIGVADLPAAADFAALQPMIQTLMGEAEEDDGPPTQANLMPVPQNAQPRLEKDVPTKARPSGSQRSSNVNLTASLIADDPDSTSIRPYPTAEVEKTRAVPVPKKPENWRSSNVLGPPPPMPTGIATMTVREGGLTRSWRPFAISSVFGVIAIGVAALLFDGTTKRVRLGWDLVPVMVASVELPEGTTITVDMVAERAVPEAFVTSSVVRPDSVQYLINQKILVPTQAGDPLLWSQFEVAHANERLSKKIQKKARGYDLLTGRLIAVGGWVQPNDRIDIIASLRPNAGKSGKVAVTVLQDVRVLSTGKVSVASLMVNGKATERDYVDVSLLLLPEEAEVVALANEVGELQFTLRPDEDHDTMDAEHRGTNSKTLLEGERVRLLQVKRSEIINQVRSKAPPRSK